MLTREFGKYRLARRLGRGGMADVYLAHDTETGRDVALKLLELRPDRDSQEVYDAERRGAVLQEAFAAVDPHVPAVHAYGTLAGHFYLDMEYVEGEDLAERLARGPFAPEQAVRIVLEVCDFLERAHAFETTVDGHRMRGIIHGDLKPKNVRIGPGETVKILDFGIAKGLSLTRKLTRNDFGSPAYLSPERLDAGAVDVRSDCWAVGVLLYELLSSDLPFRGETNGQLERQILARVLPAPLPVACPTPLVRVVHKILHGDAGRRYPDARAIGADLRRWQSGGETIADREWTAGWLMARPGTPDEAADPRGDATRRTTPTAGAAAGEHDTPPADPRGGAAGRRDVDPDGTRRTVERDEETGIDEHATTRRVPGEWRQPEREGARPGSPEARHTDPRDDLAAIDADAAGSAPGMERPDSRPADRDRLAGLPIDAEPGDGGRAAPDGPRLEAPVGWAASPADAARLAAPRTALPGRAPRRGRLRSAALATAALAVIVASGNELRVWAQARELHVAIATRPPSETGAIWVRYEQLARQSVLGIGTAGVRGPLRDRLLAQAERVVGNYRQHSPVVREAQWIEASAWLTNALALDPGSRTLTARLRYCEGHLHRIDGEAKRRRKQPATESLNDAVARFEEAARFDQGWPDPYLGLARVYVYGLEDLDRAIAALDEAERRGYRAGSREVAQLADGYRARAERQITDADTLEGLPEQRQSLDRAASDLRQAIDLYQKAAGFGDAGASLKVARRRLDEVEARLERLDEPNLLERLLREVVKRDLGPF